MITDQLLSYIKQQLLLDVEKNIIVANLKGVGWTEADIDEAFKSIIPIENFRKNFFGKKTKTKSFWPDLVFVIIGLVCVVSWYFYRPQIINFWNSTINNLPELSMPSFNFDKIMGIFGINKIPNNTVGTQNNSTIKPIVNVVKDCGVGTTPDLRNPLTYENNAVLNCLGESALHCIDARALLKNVSFPTVFEIVQDTRTSQSTCSFKLSYGQDSTLVDINGQKLAGQSITCPLDIVKAVDESKKVPSFNVPSTDNLSKYVSQIYFYGMLGVFLENNFDQNKIQSLGCSGDYISSVIASYLKNKEKK